ncbi:MAG: ABC transporter ATP-binding protein [Lachnospiraceae bacterium]|nr:ABC transporter ATP-binding protein [Lachnospiraceae bacterium]
MKFQLEKRKYDWRDLVRIPFACEPLCAAALMGQKLLTGIVNVLWVLVEAEFIETALACAMGKAQMWDAYPLLVAMLLIIFWKRMGWNLGRLPMGKLHASVEYQTRMEVVKKRSRLRYSLIEDSRTWELCQRVAKEMTRNTRHTLSTVCDFSMSMVRILGVLLIVFVESPLLGGIMLLVMVPLVGLSVKSGKHIYIAFRKASENERRGEYLQNILVGREAVDERSLFAYTEFVNKEWNTQRENYRKTSVHAQAMQELRKSGSGIMTNCISTVIVLVLAWELFCGRLGIGIFIALSKAIYDIINLMYNELGYSIANISRSVAFYQELTEFANLPEAEGVNDLPVEEKQEFKSLEFKNVSFRYPGGEQYIIKNMNMVIKAGQHYAFVGENGAGKTTITKLMTGLYEDYEGSILLNGKELREYEAAQLKAMYSNVYQDFARYQDTVENNILLGDIHSMNSAEVKQRMEKYTRALGIYEELAELPEGFSTPLGKLADKSVDLSGGQWQRVIMARSMMSPAGLQILDEPTAALDPISESKLYEEFGRISNGKTTIFISHRLGSTKLADCIFVLKDGNVCEAGTHEELMTQNGLYAQMYDSQKSWYMEGSEVSLYE